MQQWSSTTGKHYYPPLTTMAAISSILRDVDNHDNHPISSIKVGPSPGSLGSTPPVSDIVVTTAATMPPPWRLMTFMPWRRSRAFLFRCRIFSVPCSESSLTLRHISITCHHIIHQLPSRRKISYHRLLGRQWAFILTYSLCDMDYVQGILTILAPMSTTRPQHQPPPTSTSSINNGGHLHRPPPPSVDGYGSHPALSPATMMASTHMTIPLVRSFLRSSLPNIPYTFVDIYPHICAHLCVDVVGVSHTLSDEADDAGRTDTIMLRHTSTIYCICLICSRLMQAQKIIPCIFVDHWGSSLQFTAKPCVTHSLQDKLSYIIVFIFVCNSNGTVIQSNLLISIFQNLKYS